MQSRYFAEALRQAAAASPDFVVLLGDLTARGGAQAFAAVAEIARACPVQTFILPGNSDVRDTPIETYRQSFGQERFSFRKGNLLFLGLDTSQPSIQSEQREWVARQITAAAPARPVVFTHMPPHKLDSNSRAFLEGLLPESGVLLCVAGHSHRAGFTHPGDCPVHTLAGTDPFKPVSEQPGFDLFTVSSGGELRTERRPITLLSEPKVAAVFARLGAAPRDFDSTEQLVHFLSEHNLKHLQIKRRSGPPDLVQCLNAWRGATPGASLSVHLNTPKADDDGRLSNRSELQSEVDLALSLNAASVTVHLPKMDSELVIVGHDRFKRNRFTESLRQELASLLNPLVSVGCEIHLENLRWRGEGLRNERSLGTVPSHLVAFREALEGSLPVGFNLDIGHAWGNGALASKYPPFRWFEALHPHIRSIHLHDTVPREGKQINHQPIGSDGGMICLEGIFYLLAHLAPQAVVYLEMNNLPDIALSLDRMRAWAGSLTQLRSARSSHAHV
jgi:sugar phosphate isomerase/epimerase/predicted phosphodiesterase